MSFLIFTRLSFSQQASGEARWNRWRSGEQEEEVDLNQNTWQAPSASNISTTSSTIKWQWKVRWTVLWPVTFGGFNGRITDSYEPQLYWEKQTARQKWQADGFLAVIPRWISKDLLSSPEYKPLSDLDYKLVGILARNSGWDYVFVLPRFTLPRQNTHTHMHVYLLIFITSHFLLLSVSTSGMLAT